MTVRRWWGLWAGVFVALVVPASYYVLALLVQSGTVHLETRDDGMQTITAIALSEAILGPLGIVVAGISAGLRSAVGWFVLLLVGLPGLFFVWFLCVATLSGAMGAPF
jgi:hypothetical protein